jgi:SAM-dependent methyltransferase
MKYYAVGSAVRECSPEVMAMGSDAGGQYRYSADGAKIYGTLGIEGTTYEIGYGCVRESLGDGIAGKVFLDFGCGAGRTTFFLKALGAEHVYGVDHDRNMLGLALAARPGGVEFFLISDAIPLPDEAADGAISLTVFVEIRTMAAMSKACGEVARVLRRGSPFIMMSVSPMAFGHTFRSFGYPAAEPLQSGDITTAIVAAPGGQFPIDDTYWTEEDYRGALAQAGFAVASVDYPRPRDHAAWSQIVPAETYLPGDQAETCRHPAAGRASPLPDGQPRRMMAAWHRCRAMSGASTARSRHGAANRNAWRRARDFPSGCGGLRSAVRITARRPARHCLRDTGWPGVTVARPIPRSASRWRRRCQPC